MPSPSKSTNTYSSRSHPRFMLPSWSLSTRQFRPLLFSSSRSSRSCVVASLCAALMSSSSTSKPMSRMSLSVRSVTCATYGHSSSNSESWRGLICNSSGGMLAIRTLPFLLTVLIFTRSRFGACMPCWAYCSTICGSGSASDCSTTCASGFVVRNTAICISSAV